MLAVVLSELEENIESQASVRIGTGSGARHPSSILTKRVNDAFRRYQTFLTSRGFSWFIEETAALALPTTRADTDEPYSVVPWPTVARTIELVSVLVSNRWTDCDRIEWPQIRRYSHGHLSGLSAGESHRPLAFAPKKYGEVSGTSAAAGEIALTPFAPVGQYRVGYIPEHANIEDDTTAFRYPDQLGIDWVVFSVAMKYQTRDGDSRRRYAMLRDELSRVEAEIGRATQVTINSGPLTMDRSSTYRS